MSLESNAHEQCVTCSPVFRLIESPGCPERVITRKIIHPDPGITILGSQLTGLARLSYNRKGDFCCVYLRCRVFCKVGQPGACNQALSSIAKFYAFPLTSPIFQSSRAHTQNFSPPASTSSFLY